MKTLFLTLIGLLTIFTPIYGLLFLVIIVTTTDMVTAIHRDWIKNKDLKGFWKKIRIVKSSKLRRTFTKTSYYLLTILLLYAIPLVCFDAEIISLWVAKLATFSLVAHEMFSIGENIGLITGDNIISKVIRKSFKKLNEWTNKQIEDTKKPN